LQADPQLFRGRMRMAPFDDGVLALQTSYVSPGEGAAPRLADVAVGWGHAAGSGPDEARRWFERMDAARRSGDWVAFGRAYEELRRILTSEPDTLP
jgi:hypothetical protein